MKFFLDTSSLQEIQEAIGLRLVDGISLNILDSSRDKNYYNFISEIADILDGPIIVSVFFENEEDVPKYAISMGIKTIMLAKKIILLASGKNKAEAKKIGSQNMATKEVKLETTIVSSISDIKNSIIEKKKLNKISHL
jgi:hypothetical protein